VRQFNLNSDEWDSESDRDGFRGRATRVARRLGGERIGASLYDLDDGQRICPYHYHHGVEEWLLVVAGTPVLRTPAGEQTLRRGDVVCFPIGPDGAHSVQGPGRVLLLSANRVPSISVYPDSDKLGTRPPVEHARDGLNFPRGAAVDYWEGE
jgi:uncharacterized cupin superfamily protein